jgi:predicted nucleotidyltransferase
MSFDTYLLDEAVRSRGERREQLRQQTLAAVLRLLDELGPVHGFDHAYVFGSLVESGHFQKTSDVDIAVKAADPADFFDLMTSLSMALGRDVDLVDLGQCHFAERIREKGKKWMKKR